MREKKVSKIEVHAAGICLDKDKVLVAKRSPGRKIYPNLWECGGGEVESGENFQEAVTRQMREELGVIVKPIQPLKAYEILTPDSEQKKIPGLSFVCELTGFANGKTPQINKEHSEWKWQPIDRLDDLEFIHDGIKEEIKKAYLILKEK